MIYPCLEKYLGKLPGGINSYPQCMMKGSLFIDMIASRPVSPNPDSVPGEVFDCIHSPPPLSGWVPTTVFNATTLVVYEEHFGGKDIDAFQQWHFDFNYELFNKVIYRALFTLISTEQLFRSGEKRWHTFHKGTSFRILENQAGYAVVRLEFPANVFCNEMLPCLMSGLRAALAVAGAKDLVGKSLGQSSSFLEYSCTWR